MSRSNPTPAEVQDYDAEIREGDLFRNRYQEHSHAPGTRVIKLIHKHVGFWVEYEIVEEYRRKFGSNVGGKSHMSTKNLLVAYEPMPDIDTGSPETETAP